MVTIYALAYNEELMLPFFIAHYRSMFPSGCKIIIYDNMSTDKTRQIAEEAGCEVWGYDTKGRLDDQTYLRIKNNCWKDAATDWVMIVDIDEFCHIGEGDLVELGEKRLTPSFHAYNMVNMHDNLDIQNIDHGFREPFYDKVYCFNKTIIEEINYAPGCHICSPKVRGSNSPSVKLNTLGPYLTCHYKYINPDYMVNRHAEFNKRLSLENRQQGYGIHYQNSEEQIRREFYWARVKAKQVISQLLIS